MELSGGWAGNISLANMTLLSSLVAASMFGRPEPTGGASVRVGILVLLPLLASPEIYRFAVQMSPLVMCSRNSVQWAFLAIRISFPY